MSGSKRPFPPTFTVDPLLSPPARPPRLRPPSRSSSVATDLDHTPISGVWPDVTLATLINDSEDKLPGAPYPYYKDYRRSFMHMDSTDTFSPVRDSGLDVIEDKPLHIRDRVKTGSDLRRGGSCRTNSAATPRSKVMSVFLVLSCAGAMVINVSSAPPHLCSVQRPISSARRPRTLLLFLSPSQQSGRNWGSMKINYNGSFLLTPSQRYVRSIALTVQH